MATRTSADIQSKEDYVDLVMKPGESLTSSFSHELHHEDDSHHQRHDMPHEEDGISKSDAKDVDEVARQKSDQESLNNFDGKWMNLFKFPKVNRTVASSVHQNVTSRKAANETAEQIEEREIGKMVELQNEADSLAKLVEESSKKKVSPDEVKNAAANLERKAEELQKDVIENFVNRSESKAKNKETGTQEKGNARAEGDKNEDEKNRKTTADKVSKGNEKMSWKGKQGDEGEGDCSNCGSKIPKPGEKVKGPIVPKLSKGENKTMVESDANKTESGNLFNGKKDSNDSKIDENQAVKSGQSTYFKDDSPKDEMGSLEKSLKEKKIKAKAKEKQKSMKDCKDCEIKAPKPGDKDDGKLIVPKLTGANETKEENGFVGNEGDKKKVDKVVEKTDGKGEKSKSKGFNGNEKTSKSSKDCNNCQGQIPKPGDKDDGKLIVPKLTGANETKEENGFVGNDGDKTKVDKVVEKTDGKGEKSKSKGFNGNEKTSKSSKDCNNCQGRIPNPGDKDDGELIVPKLTKENETEKTTQHSKFRKINIHVPVPDKSESFDLDDDAQDITEGIFCGFMFCMHLNLMLIAWRSTVIVNHRELRSPFNSLQSALHKLYVKKMTFGILPCVVTKKQFLHGM